MKQTAVEWLYNNLKSHFEHDGDLLECVQMSMQQAKEMEKEQMVDFAFKYGDLTAREIAYFFDKEYKTNEK
jgi:hypothetical protein